MSTVFNFNALVKIIIDGSDIAIVDMVKVKAMLGESVNIRFMIGAIENISECIGIPTTLTIAVDSAEWSLTIEVSVSIEKYVIIIDERIMPKRINRYERLNTFNVHENADDSFSLKLSLWTCSL